MYIGTHKILFNKLEIETLNTTLNIDHLISILNKYKIKPKMIVMEVSSHGINQARVNCFKFDIVGLTNLGSDHLDFHLNINNYHNVKYAFLNSLYKAKNIFIPIQYKNKYIFTNKSIVFYDSNIIKNHFNTLDFNKENMTLAYYILKCLIKNKDLIKILNGITLNNGRAQIIKDNNRKIVIDYAHQIESFNAILNNNNYNKVVVFGCGGNRDSSKRKIMGEIAKKYCKYVIITKDNPRNEDINKINKDICENISEYMIILDRYKAIQYAINTYKDLDIFILGKGDENFILENNSKIKFNDYNTVIEILKNNINS